MSNSWNDKCWTVDLPKTRKLSHTVILKYRWIFLLAVNLFTITVIHLNQSVCSLFFEYSTLIWRVQRCYSRGICSQNKRQFAVMVGFYPVMGAVMCFLPHCSKTSLSGRAWICFTAPSLAGAVLQNSSPGQYLGRVARKSLWILQFSGQRLWLTGDSILQKGCHNAFCSFLLEIYCLPQWFLS